MDINALDVSNGPNVRSSCFPPPFETLLLHQPATLMMMNGIHTPFWVFRSALFGIPRRVLALGTATATVLDF